MWQCLKRPWALCLCCHGRDLDCAWDSLKENERNRLIRNGGFVLFWLDSRFVSQGRSLFKAPFNSRFRLFRHGVNKPLALCSSLRDNCSTADRLGFKVPSRSHIRWRSSCRFLFLGAEFISEPPRYLNSVKSPTQFRYGTPFGIFLDPSNDGTGCYLPSKQNHAWGSNTSSSPGQRDQERWKLARFTTIEARRGWICSSPQLLYRRKTCERDTQCKDGQAFNESPTLHLSGLR